MRVGNVALIQPLISAAAVIKGTKRAQQYRASGVPEKCSQRPSRRPGQHYKTDAREKKTAGSGKRDRNGMAAIKQWRSVPVTHKDNCADHGRERAERARELCRLFSSESKQADGDKNEV